MGVVKIKSRKEITKELRKMNQDKLNKECPESRYCHICGIEEGVQNHHIIKVEDLSKMAYYHKIDDLGKMYIPTTDLCDYHHKVWHGCTGDTNYIDEDISLDTFYGIVDILGEVDLTLAPSELYPEYKATYDEMINSFLFELKERYAFSEDEIEEMQDILTCASSKNVDEVQESLPSDNEIDDDEFDDDSSCDILE